MSPTTTHHSMPPTATHHRASSVPLQLCLMHKGTFSSPVSGTKNQGPCSTGCVQNHYNQYLQVRPERIKNETAYIDTIRETKAKQNLDAISTNQTAACTCHRSLPLFPRNIPASPSHFFFVFSNLISHHSCACLFIFSNWVTLHYKNYHVPTKYI